MISSKRIIIQIKTLTTELIETGLCDDQTFPSLYKTCRNIEEVGITHAESSIFLKSIPYANMYQELIKKRFFNVKMIDGALISMQYRFKEDLLIAHRLSFFPSPNLELFQNDPEVYIEDEVYADILDRRIVTVPLRFDFDNNEDICKPIAHPISHLTIGQYSNCRIPVSSALTPYQFISFIIMNFYHTAHKRYQKDLSVYKDCFSRTLFAEEHELLHLHTPTYTL
ncbi:MAG: DUF2290 domain-containing protein [Bacillota bacterium]|nr:DUF2290 domain-containing protein [Bacillota bacterium]